jgi:hypothetical protein
MTDMLLMIVVIIALVLLFMTFYFHTYFTSIAGIITWIFLAISFSAYPLMIAVCIVLALVNAYLTLALIMGK